MSKSQTIPHHLFMCFIISGALANSAIARYLTTFEGVTSDKMKYSVAILGEMESETVAGMTTVNEVPIEANVSLTCDDPACGKNFKATFCIPEKVFNLSPECGKGMMYDLEKNIVVQSGSYRARLSGGVCVRVIDKNFVVSPYPDTLFFNLKYEGETIAKADIRPIKIKSRKEVNLSHLPECDTSLVVK